MRFYVVVLLRIASLLLFGHQPCSPFDLRKIHGCGPFGIVGKSKMIDCITEFLGAVLILARVLGSDLIVKSPLLGPSS